MSTKNKKALIIVDVQNDFCPGGSLAVKNSAGIIPVITRYIDLFVSNNDLIIFTRDWHPQDHCSFSKEGGIWPVHCVANTKGAEFHSDLKIPENAVIVSKADNPTADAYSGFDNTELNGILKKDSIDELWICGLATDYCVKSTVNDALKLGYKVKLLTDAIEAVEVNKGDGSNAIKEMVSNGAEIYSFN